LRILYLSETYAGSVHDKAICDQEMTQWPTCLKLHQDTGFQGHQPPGVQIIQPKKKPRGNELSANETQDNKEKSRFRVVVEHAIGRVKICRIVKDRIRCWKSNIQDRMMEICCGLHNFRLTNVKAQ
jgi:hypothetical protein